MTDDELHAIYRRVEKALETSEDDAVNALAPVRESSESAAAQCCAHALLLPGWSIERRHELGSSLLKRCASNWSVVEVFASNFEAFVEMRLLNDPPPASRFGQGLLEAVTALHEARTGRDRLESAKAAWSVSRLSGHSADALTERFMRQILELEPDNWTNHYNHGLFLKTRGRFEEGLAANQRAAQLGGSDNEPVIWNTGICATGAGRGQVALELWREKLEMKLELGSSGLPEGRFHEVKVRLSARPVAARTEKDDSPGDEETVWIDRLSPCHGRVLSALTADLGVDIGDLVLFDGSPISHQTYEGQKVPVFPQLTTLRRGGWRTFWFRAHLPDPAILESVNNSLPRGAILYSHTRQVRLLCRACSAKGIEATCSHDGPRAESRSHRGKLCVPPEVSLAEVDRVIAEAIHGRADAWVAAPEFAEALGDRARARREQKQFELE